MGTYRITCSISMTYDIEAKSEKEARAQAIDVFANDTIFDEDVRYLSVDVDVESGPDA